MDISFTEHYEPSSRVYAAGLCFTNQPDNDNCVRICTRDHTVIGTVTVDVAVKKWLTRDSGSSQWIHGVMIRISVATGYICYYSLVDGGKILVVCPYNRIALVDLCLREREAGEHLSHYLPSNIVSTCLSYLSERHAEILSPADAAIGRCVQPRNEAAELAQSKFERKRGRLLKRLHKLSAVDLALAEARREAEDLRVNLEAKLEEARKLECEASGSARDRATIQRELEELEAIRAAELECSRKRGAGTEAEGAPASKRRKGQK